MIGGTFSFVLFSISKSVDTNFTVKKSDFYLNKKKC